jgi:hypothetical protein
MFQIQMLETESQAVRAQMTSVLTQHEGEMQATRKELERLYAQVQEHSFIITLIAYRLESTMLVSLLHWSHLNHPFVFVVVNTVTLLCHAVALHIWYSEAWLLQSSLDGWSSIHL